MLNMLSAHTPAGKNSAKHIILVGCLSLLGLFSSPSWADDDALEIKLSTESKSVKIDHSTEITASVSREKVPAANARVRWTQIEGPAKASLFPGKGKTNAKGVSQLRVLVHTPGKYKFLAEACGESKSKTFCEKPAKTGFEVEANIPVPVGIEKFLLGTAIAAPVVAGTAGENLLSNSNSNLKVKFASLTAQTSTDISGAVNTNTPLSALYLYGETGFVGQSVNWTVTPAATLSSTSTPVSSEDGLVSINFQTTAPGTYFVTATGTCPSNLSTDVCAPPTQNFRIKIDAPSLINISGNAQSAGLGLTLAAPLVVQAQNAGISTPGVSIAWTVVSGSATLGSPTSTTNAVGLASNTVTAGAAAGPIVIRAERTDAPLAFILFTLNAVVAQLDRASPTTVSGSSSGSFNLTTFSNFAGTANNSGQVFWTSNIPGQTNFSSAATTINSGGRSNVTVTTTQGGSYIISACWNTAGSACNAGDPTTTFTINSNSLRMVSGNSQALVVSQASAPLVVQLLSGGFANPQSITWSVTGPATLANAATTTDGSGNSTNTLTFTGAGNAIVKASWPSVAGQPIESVKFNLASTANAYRITPNSSLNVAGTIGFPSNLSVDYNFNGTAATSLQTQWSIVSGPGGGILGSATSVVAANADSVNTFTPTIDGNYRIRVQGTCPAAADPDCPGNAVEFIVSTGSVTRTLNISSGNGQSAATNAAFASPLVVLANDNGSPAIGVTIDWIVTNGDSLLSSGTSVTNGSGLTSINVTAGPSNGTTTIRATRQDEPSAFTTFNLSVGTNTYTLVANGSNNYDLPLGFGIFLSANYTINGIPAIGQNVLWSTASGFLTATTVPVDASGNAETIYFPPFAAGVYTVTASVDCPIAAAPPAGILGNGVGNTKGSGTTCPPPNEIFTITVIDKSLVLDSGDGQSAALATSFSSPLSVQALDDGVPVAGVAIDWTISFGSATFTSANPSITDASGFATMTVDAGNVAGPININATRQDSGAGVSFNLTATGNVYALTTVSANDITINVGDVADLDVNYVVNGSGDTSLQTLWSASGGTLGSSNSPVDSAGDSSNTFTSAVIGDFTVTVDGSCPVSPDPACPIAPVTFTIHVVSATQVLILHAGNNQTTPLGTTFPNTIVVLAENSGVAASGVQINWSVTSGDAILSSGTTTTDTSGFSQINVDATGNSGPIQITAERDDSGNSVVFDLESTFAPRLDVISGDDQSGPPNTPAAAPIVVQLTNGGGIGLPDRNVDWTVLSGDAVLDSGSTVTDGSGNANVTFSFGNTVGPIQIEATNSGLSVITNHEVLAVSRTLFIDSGDTQTTTPNTTFTAPLIVTAQDSGYPASGVTINWAVSSGDATLSAATSDTDGSGMASINVNAGNTVGPVVITATRSDEPTATTSFTLNIAAAVSTLALSRTSGNGEVAFINVPFASPLVVNATNNGVADADITINWVLASGSAVLSSGTSDTDSAGDASITVTAGPVVGPISITATRADEPTASVTFSLSASPTPNNTLVIVSGDGQSGVIGSPANSPLVVVLRDGFGNAISGQTVNWSVISGPATLTNASSVSDAGGQASNTFSFGSGSGASVIRASAFGGALNIDFAANAVMVSLVASSGNGQAGPVSTALPVALTVQISLPAGVFAAPGSGPRKPLALSGVPITFAVTGGGGSVSLINALTNAAGQASTVLTLGPAAGINTVSATVLGGPSTSFSATGLTAAVASGLTIVSGNNQVLDPSVSSS
ncbi:MAG: beta strand repeat-containing protein, partial [Arenimonas sp.]